jgi:hypothetical protein
LFNLRNTHNAHQQQQQQQYHKFVAKLGFHNSICNPQQWKFKAIIYISRIERAVTHLQHTKKGNTKKSPLQSHAAAAFLKCIRAQFLPFINAHVFKESGRLT